MGSGQAAAGGRVARHAGALVGTGSWTLPVLVASLLAASCGGGGGGDRGPGAGDRAKDVGIVPTKAAVIATVRLDRGERRGVGSARDVLRRIPAWRAFDRRLPTAQDVIDGLGDAGAFEDLSWTRDVRPWLGTSGGAAGWGNPGEHGREAVGGIAWVEVRSERRAAAAAARAFGGRHAKGERGGVLLHAGHLADGTRISWATFASRLVVATDAHALEASVDAAGGTSYEDRDDWKRLSRPRRVNRGTTIARLLLTRNLFTRDTLDQLESSGERADGLVGQLRDMPGARLLESDDLDGVALQVGATDRGLWLDAVAVGELPVPRVAVGAAQTLGRLPIGTLAGAATSAGGVASDDAVELAREQVKGLRDLADAKGGHASARQRQLATAFAEAATPLLEKDAVEEARDAWGKEAAVGILLDGGVPWLVAAAEVEDPRAADAALLRTVESAGTVLGEVVPGSAVVTNVLEGDGGAFTISGLRAAREQVAAGLAGGDAETAVRIAASPAFQHVFAASLTGAWRTDGENQLFALPSARLDAIAASWTEGTDRLADDPVFADGFADADAPGDAILAWWLDSARVGGLVADSSLDGRIAGVVKSQLSPLGGPLGWVEVRREGSATVQRVAIELPIAG